MNEKPKIIYAETNDYNEKLIFWKSFLEAHPDYFDGWFELSSLEVKLGNKIEAEKAYLRALEINPNESKLVGLSNEISKLTD